MDNHFTAASVQPMQLDYMHVPAYNLTTIYCGHLQTETHNLTGSRMHAPFRRHTRTLREAINVSKLWNSQSHWSHIIFLKYMACRKYLVLIFSNTTGLYYNTAKMFFFRQDVVLPMALQCEDIYKGVIVEMVFILDISTVFSINSFLTLKVVQLLYFLPI